MSREEVNSSIWGEDYGHCNLDEQAVYTTGEGTQLLLAGIPVQGEPLQQHHLNVEEMIDDHWDLRKLTNTELARNLCMEFCYYDKGIGVDI